MKYSAENNELKREREAANERISMLTISVEHLTDENKELKKELSYYKQGLGSVSDKVGGSSSD